MNELFFEVKYLAWLSRKELFRGVLWNLLLPGKLMLLRLILPIELTELISSVFALLLSLSSWTGAPEFWKRMTYCLTVGCVLLISRLGRLDFSRVRVSYSLLWDLVLCFDCLETCS